MKRVLIVSNRDDEHANYVDQRLAARGTPVVRFNTETVPRLAKIVVKSDERAFRITVTDVENRVLWSAEEVRSVWYRRPFFEDFAYLIRDEEQRFAIKENEVLLENIWSLLNSVIWINPRDASRRANNKLFQLSMAHDMGLRTPDTLVTNDAAIADTFMRQHQRSGVIYKTMSDPVVSQHGSSARCVYTTRIEPSARVLQSVEVVACLLQEYVPKAYELRIAVVGDRLFAARIYSQDADRSKIDWRRGVSGGELRQEVEERLDPSTATKCIELVRRLGLRFGAIDMICTPGGEHVFLEVNPNGQWLWMEMLLGLPIADALIEILETAGDANS